MTRPPTLPLLTFPTPDLHDRSVILDVKTQRDLFFILFSLRNYIADNLERCQENQELTPSEHPTSMPIFRP